MSACAHTGKEPESQEPWRMQTPNFAYWFRDIKTWILQNMNFVAHHSPENWCFSVPQAWYKLRLAKGYPNWQQGKSIFRILWKLHNHCRPQTLQNGLGMEGLPFCKIWALQPTTTLRNYFLVVRKVAVYEPSAWKPVIANGWQGQSIPRTMKSSDPKLCTMVKIDKDLNPAKYELSSPP
jgi:hypothetical protein